MRRKTIAALILTALLLVIMLQNTQTVIIRFLFWEIILPQIILIFLVLVIGFLLGYIVSTLSASRRSRARP